MARMALADLREQEALLKKQLADLQDLQNSDEFKKEIEFEDKLRNLLGEYGFSLKNVIAILDPKGVSTRAKDTSSQRPTRKARNVKIYTHPLTGAVIETKGGNHKLLKEWKAEHGSEEVESWAQVAQG